VRAADMQKRSNDEQKRTNDEQKDEQRSISKSKP
jgi:hypothetical protein